MAVALRKIEKEDNKELALIIRTIFEEFNIKKEGTVYSDPTTDTLFEVFEADKSIYWIAEEDGIMLGGCGVFPTDGLPTGCAELVKFYLSNQSRGKGLGKLLMEKSIQSAQELGYNQLYLESFPELATAVGMYEKAGFKMLSGPLGNSGHFACNIWMLKDLV